MKGGKQMAGKLVMVTGGARSGKSEFAEQYVLHYAPKCDYIATAEVLICAVERGDLNWRDFVNPRSEYNRRKKAQL